MVAPTQLGGVRLDLRNGPVIKWVILELSKLYC